MATLPEMMTAIVIKAPGGPEVLVAAERPVPVPDPGEILIRVGAAGVNRPDIMQRRGQYPPPPGAPVEIPGLEVAGEVVARGAGATRFALGDAVCALLPGAGYAEYAKVDETNALPVPRGFTDRGGRRHPRDVLHHLAVDHGARSARGGRVDPHPRRRVRGRHQRHPAG